MKPDRYSEILGRHLGEELYRHSVGVAETAAALSLRYGADRQKACLAGLLHDYARGYTREQMLEKARSANLILDPLTLSETRLLHAPVGAALLRMELGIDDPEIISAVTYHTTGRRKMSLLEKVVYLADFIEPNRDFPGIGLLRKLAHENLDAALLSAVDLTIKSVLERGLPLHPRSVRFRNSLLDQV